MVRRISIAVFVIFAFFPCVSCSLKNMKIEDINTDPLIFMDCFSEYEKVGYMAKELLTETEHKKLMEHFKAKYEKEAKFPKAGMTSIAASTIVTGNPLSYKGVKTAGQLDLAFFAMDLLKGEPHKGFVTKIYLPAEINGKALTYWEDAKTFFIHYLDEKIKKYADKYQYQLNYMDDKGGSKFVSLSDGSKEFYLKIYFDPRNLQVNDYLDPIRDGILGFHTAWKSIFDAVGVSILIGREFKVCDPLFGSTFYSIRSGAHISSKDERYQNLMKILTEDGYMVKAVNDRSVKYVALKGKLYTFNNIKANDFINGIIE